MIDWLIEWAGELGATILIVVGVFVLVYGLGVVLR